MKYFVQITGCTNHPNIWYAKKIGRIFEVSKKVEDDDYFNIDALLKIYIEDCQVIEKPKFETKQSNRDFW